MEYEEKRKEFYHFCRCQIAGWFLVDGGAGRGWQCSALPILPQTTAAYMKADEHDNKRELKKEKQRKENRKRKNNGKRTEKGKTTKAEKKKRRKRKMRNEESRKA